MKTAPDSTTFSSLNSPTLFHDFLLIVDAAFQIVLRATDRSPGGPNVVNQVVPLLGRNRPIVGVGSEQLREINDAVRDLYRPRIKPGSNGTQSNGGVGTFILNEPFAWSKTSLSQDPQQRGGSAIDVLHRTLQR